MSAKIIDINTFFGFWPYRKVNVGIKELIKEARNHGIDKICTLSSRGICYDFIEGNEETLNVSEQFPEVIPIATINLKRYLSCYQEVEKRVKEGFKIFRLFPEIQGWPIDYAPFFRLLKIMNEYETILMISAKVGMTPLVRITKDFKNTIIFLSVSYGIKMPEAIVLMQDNPNIYVGVCLLDTPDALEILVECVGANRLLFSSGAPLNYISSSLDVIQKAQIGKKEKDLILGGNMQNILSKRSGNGDN